MQQGTEGDRCVTSARGSCPLTTAVPVCGFRPGEGHAHHVDRHVWGTHMCCCRQWGWGAEALGSGGPEQDWAQDRTAPLGPSGGPLPQVGCRGGPSVALSVGLTQGVLPAAQLPAVSWAAASFGVPG